MFDRDSTERPVRAPETRTAGGGGHVQRRRAGSVLTVGRADDQAERDADRVATEVLARLNDSELRRRGAAADGGTRIRRRSEGGAVPGEVAGLNRRIRPFDGAVGRRMEAALGGGIRFDVVRLHEGYEDRAVARASGGVGAARRVIRRMLLTEPPTTKAKTAWNTVVEKDAKNQLMRGRWRPADTSVIDRVVVRMTILALDKAKPYQEVEGEGVSPASSLKVPIEMDAGSALRHWWMLFRIPKPEFGDRTQSEWEKLDQAEVEKMEELDYQGSVDELSARAPALDPGKPAWMQVDVTMDSGGGYRIFWKPAPTSGVAARADYAGSCNSTVGQVRGAMGELAKEYTKYVNPTPRAGDSPVVDLYSCHTFVRKMNAKLSLGIEIPAIDKYT